MPGKTMNAPRGSSVAIRLPSRTGIQRSAPPHTTNVGAATTRNLPTSVSNLNCRNTPRKARPYPGSATGA